MAWDSDARRSWQFALGAVRGLVSAERDSHQAGGRPLKDCLSYTPLTPTFSLASINRFGAIGGHRLGELAPGKIIGQLDDGLVIAQICCQVQPSCVTAQGNNFRQQPCNIRLRNPSLALNAQQIMFSIKCKDKNVGDPYRTSEHLSKSQTQSRNAP